MADLGLSVSPGLLLLGASLYYLGGGAALAAFLTAALAHELGHLAAIYWTGAFLRRVRFSAAGPVIEYGGVTNRQQEAGIIAAGPVAGLLFAAVCTLAGSRYFAYVGAIALLSSLFNLLPALPMDGGRLAQLLLEEVMPPDKAAIILRIVGSFCAAGVIATGIRLCLPAAAAAGIWMLALANVPDLR